MLYGYIVELSNLAIQQYSNYSMISSVIPVYKPLGWTPLQTLQWLKQTIPALREKKLAYAGRLDPMAEGVLLVLVGEECKKREQYQQLPKTYELTIVFGFSTDSYDLLGKVTAAKKVTDPKAFLHRAQKACSDLVGQHVQPYPPYSSARVNGRPLFYWARHNLLHTVKIPQKKIEITSIEPVYMQKLTQKELLAEIQTRIETVQGNFRQTEILADWQSILDQYQDFELPLLTLSVSASSGTYMRSLAVKLAEKLHTRGCAFSIKRTVIGIYTQRDCLVIENV